ncbi:carboxylating nicotinate-nucleotide diphosphorylase [Legionella septentrionalis]|uniref:nicotinate-nucleotide diphosphorylase (carboxylating) n=1 Tax=Legionella septentrionalis TaxID=2498109 RepID=A0A433JI25_9GAMM|nr:carboxylating nicotinate-nucleotide diphosphorylase [Legionella septentrionalis]RUQ84532.1 carboxylating nicotinate-nucleotide diphosphorylase [Legionella septentrionalis]
MTPEHGKILADVKRALAEDVGSGDVTAALLPLDLVVMAKIISREPMVVCGRPWVDCIFAEVDLAIHVQWQVDEGQWLPEPATLCQIEGPVRSILTAERSALNFLQTLSATATKTREYLLKLSGYKTRLLDTRKTIPGLRYAQKYAVACAGGTNHRFGLFDAFLIKENHIKACGSIKAAVALARNMQKDLLIEVEVENLEELQEALHAKPDRILLDNFTKDMLVEAVNLTRGECELEASGGLTLATVTEVAKTGVDYISIGAITKSIQAVDLSLLIDKVLD